LQAKLGIEKLPWRMVAHTRWLRGLFICTPLRAAQGLREP
jgi:hypothetical protein